MYTHPGFQSRRAMESPVVVLFFISQKKERKKPTLPYILCIDIGACVYVYRQMQRGELLMCTSQSSLGSEDFE